MPQSTVRAVFLDAGNTLFTERRPRPAVYLTVARAHGGRGDAELAREAMVQAFRELPASVEGSFRFSVAWFEFFNAQVLGELGVSARRLPAAHAELLRRFESPRTYRVFPEVPAVLKDLANRGLILGVVSNWSERLPTLLEGLGLLPAFEFIVTSAEIKAEKPGREIFDRALFRAGVPAEETLHVGDHMERDVRGALGAGLRAAFLDRCTAQDGAHDGIPVLADLARLPALLDQPAPATHG